MAGRLRTQLKKLEAIRDAAVNLYGLIELTAPADTFTDESYDDWLDGRFADDKADAWHTMLNAVLVCSRSANDLMDMLRDRIELLPTYRPPPPGAPPQPPALPALPPPPAES